MGYDEKEALKLLKEDRLDYIKKMMNLVQGFLENDMVDLASNTICEAANGLRMVDGSILYVEQLQFYKENGYPRFKTVLD